MLIEESIQFIFWGGSYHLSCTDGTFFSDIAGKEQVFIFFQFRSFEFCITPVRTGKSAIINNYYHIMM